MEWDGEETTEASNLQSRAGDRNKGMSRPPVSDWWEEMDPLTQSHRLRRKEFYREKGRFGNEIALADQT